MGLPRCSPWPDWPQETNRWGRWWPPIYSPAVPVPRGRRFIFFFPSPRPKPVGRPSFTQKKTNTKKNRGAPPKRIPAKRAPIPLPPAVHRSLWGGPSPGPRQKPAPDGLLGFFPFLPGELRPQEPLLPILPMSSQGKSASDNPPLLELPPPLSHRGYFPLASFCLSSAQKSRHRMRFFRNSPPEGSPAYPIRVPHPQNRKTRPRTRSPVALQPPISPGRPPPPSRCARFDR